MPRREQDSQQRDPERDDGGDERQLDRFGHEQSIDQVEASAERAISTGPDELAAAQ